MKESSVQQSIRLALGSDRDVVLWRNSVGVASEWDERTGNVRRAAYGLAKGSGDLIGIVRVGKLGRFLSLEIKSPTGAVRPEQITWANLVRSFGGFAAIVRSPEEALAAVARAKSGADQ